MVVPGYRMTIVDCVIAVIIAMVIVGILLYAKNDAQDWIAQLLLLLAGKRMQLLANIIDVGFRFD